MACLILHPAPPKPRIDPDADPVPVPALGFRQDSSTPHQPPHKQESFVPIYSDPKKPCASAGNKKRSREAERRFKCIPVNKKMKMKKPVVVKRVAVKPNFLTSCPHCSFEAMNPGILAIHVDREH